MNQEQSLICKKFESAYVEPAADEIVGVALNTLHLEPLCGTRIRPTDKATGWYIFGGQSSADPNFYQPICLKHLIEKYPMIERYLSLEPGFKFIIDRNGYEDVWRETSTG